MPRYQAKASKLGDIQGRVSHCYHSRTGDVLDILRLGVKPGICKRLTSLFNATRTISCSAKPVLLTESTPKHTHPAATKAVRYSGRAVSLSKVYGWIHASVSVLFAIPTLISLSTHSAEGKEGMVIWLCAVFDTNWKMRSRAAGDSLSGITTLEEYGMCGDEARSTLRSSKAMFSCSLKACWLRSGIQNLKQVSADWSIGQCGLPGRLFEDCMAPLRGVAINLLVRNICIKRRRCRRQGSHLRCLRF